MMNRAIGFFNFLRINNKFTKQINLINLKLKVNVGIHTFYLNDILICFYFCKSLF